MQRSGAEPMTGSASGHCVLTLLRPDKTPSGQEVRAHLRRLVRQIRQHWPNTVITVRGDSHYGRWEAMEWCEHNAVQYVFGLEKNTVLNTWFKPTCKLWRPVGPPPGRIGRGIMPRRSMPPVAGPFAAAWWPRIAATYQGLDTRYVVTNITRCAA